MIVIAGRPANEHILQHLLDGARRTAIADEIGPEFAVTRPAEGHIVAEDFDFDAVFFDRRKCVVGKAGFNRVVEFDVGDFPAADDAFLRFGRQRIPCVEIVEILLDDDVAAAKEGGIFLADKDRVIGRAARGVFGAVHETQQIALVEVAEAVDFVRRRNGAPKPRHDLRGKLKAEVHPLRADVKDQVARCRDRVSRTGADFAEGMQLPGAGHPEQALPSFGAEPHDAGEDSFGVAKTYRA